MFPLNTTRKQRGFLAFLEGKKKWKHWPEMGQCLPKMKNMTVQHNQLLKKHRTKYHLPELGSHSNSIFLTSLNFSNNASPKYQLSEIAKKVL